MKAQAAVLLVASSSLVMAQRPIDAIVITTTECTGKLFSAGRRCKSCSAIVFPSPGEITQLDSGVRGFNDRTAMLMRSGHSIFFQPSNQNDLSTYILPFHTDTTTTKATCMDAPAMDYTTDIKMWNSGRYDSWCTGRSPGMGMAYFNRTDLPYYYQLYESFVAGDAYHQSTFTQTNPNRLHLFSGSNGLSVGHAPVLDNSEPRPGWTWTTMCEILEAANISWRVIQQPDNFDDDGNAWFKNFQDAKPGSPLYEKGVRKVDDIVAEFDRQLANGSLPAVTYLVGPQSLSEHATAHPAAGEDLTARLLARLRAYPDMYKSTLMILNYDEGGQFFDHMWAPTPPLATDNGVSTVTTVGEVNSGKPIGLGFRVPMLLVSPWSRGDIVLSEVYDHTSTIKLIEERFNVSNPNISPWRRAVTGSLVTGLDFENPDYTWPDLPDTSGYAHESDVQCETLPAPRIPATQSFPVQEPGTRRSRALPHTFLVNDTLSSSSLTVQLTNAGSGGAAFTMYDAMSLEAVTPRQYAVEAGKAVTDAWAVPAAGAYHVVLHGPNGFLRSFAGDTSATAARTALASLVYDAPTGTAIVALDATASTVPLNFSIVDNAYGAAPTFRVVSGGFTATVNVDVSSSGRWYDLTVSVGASLERRFMGRIENGTESITDPAMAAGVRGFAHDVALKRGMLPRAVQDTAALARMPHPTLPPEHQVFTRKAGTHKDARWTTVRAEL